MRSDESIYILTLSDGSELIQGDQPWKEMSERRTVMTDDGKTKMVSVCLKPVTKIELRHAGEVAIIQVDKDEQVYHGVRAMSIFNAKENKVEQRIFGRYIGIIKNDKVVKEFFIQSKVDN